MFQLRINDKLDKLLKLGLALLEYQLEVKFFKSMTFLESIFTQKFEHILSCYMTLACPIDSLEKHNWTELFHESVFKVKSEIQKVSLALHQSLF